MPENENMPDSTTPDATCLHDLGNILGGDDPDYVDR